MSESIKISGIICDTVSFAMQQNHVPVVRQLVVKNCSGDEVRNIKIDITTDPAIAAGWSTVISAVQPNEEHLLTGIDLPLSASRLFELTERINGTIKITASDETGILADETRNLSFLSYDEWSGANTFPEFLAAFVTPNHPYIVEIIKKAGALLSEWTGSPSFNGYQSKNPNNVKKQMAAIYGALQRENIAYSMPPASFEEYGQKVRLSGTVKEQKLGTCLDLSLLYASCLEAAGLHAMVAVIKGHAFAGCWLEEESFAECVQDDVSALTKRIAAGINEICVVETTAFTAGKTANFENAVAAAESHLGSPENFVYLVDIKRSRGSGIRPIPQKRGDGTFAFDGHDADLNGKSITDAPDELEIMGKLQYADSIEFTRQQMWERKLLDLSLRNSLLNFRVSKSAVQLLVNSLGDLEDALSGGEEFQIMHRPQDMDNSPRDDKIYEAINKESIWNTLIKSEFQNHRIRTYLDEFSLAASISNLYRAAKTGMEENGANTLYLALGFLKWYESGVSEKARYAPLVMIPIDIIRKSAQRGYVFRLRDEEPQFNVTLLEMLRMNFGMTVTGLDPLPSDERGIDIKMVFHIIRQMIMDKPRWDVEELAFAGIFSFSQFIMWNDIRNRVDDLKRNKVVSSLISGKMEWETDIEFPSPNVLDDTVAPADLAVPISADSSQLAAVYAAGQGHSFVLHGPPGTGKSQTITNIIANALYQGKSVLFVAEKMAALTVVEKRLSSIGLGDFCLELHSNKARKKDVLDQLEKTLNVGKIKPPQSYIEEADSVLALRRELNGVVRELHAVRSFGFSVYDAISRAEQYADYPDCMTFTNAQIKALTPRQYTHLCDLCDMLSASSSSCGGVYNHPLREYKNPHYSQSERAAVENNLRVYGAVTADLRETAKRVSASMRLGDIKTYGQYAAISMICALLSEGVRIPATTLTYKELPLRKDKIAAVCECGRVRDKIKAELCERFSPQLLAYDAETALLKWNQAEDSWFLPKAMAESKIVKAVKLYALDKGSFEKAETPDILKLVYEYHKNDDAVKSSSPFFTSLLGAVYDSEGCDWALIERITNLAADLQKLIKAASPDERPGEAGENAAIAHMSEALDHNFDRFTKENGADWGNLCSLMKKTLDCETALSAQFDNPFEQWHEQFDWISAMTERAYRWSANLSGLREYCSYLLVKSELDEAGMETVYAPLENGTVKDTEIGGVFIESMSRACAMSAIDETPELGTFHGNLFSQKIEKFRSLNKQYETLTKLELAARLSSQIPVLSAGVSGSSEIGILQRAIKSGGRMMPVRKLFDSIPNLLRKLCPCMLMSPISVAQYLDPKYPAFDLVVFDEASQLPTSSAVGAIARGKELIVVGDPKQLPPTSFFSTNQIDEENAEKEDLESVLDDCLALSMPQEHLLWHYRSRHESLIAFSNRKYYDNKLFTFPSPSDMVSQVRLIPVQGFYDRGKTKQNKAEADAIVAEIIRRLSDPVLKNKSIGVVTFSSVQQNLISDLLELEFSRRPDLDEIASNAEEPIFVKNLENVQGDERDVILFSIGYGPDEEGRVALNFGPLNREGGWRRLNVAVSRARYEMMVFSVLRPEQIALTRTRSEGLAGLKAFLEFAAGGISALPVTESKKEMSCALIEVIAKKIESLGYGVRTNIGCSGYHVDIGVIDPANEDAYLLGVLCDSANYSNGGTAYDRNNTQETVLRGLGWKISRIWTLDWWENGDKELGRILRDIESARVEAAQVQIAAPVVPQPVPAVEESTAFGKLSFEVADVSADEALMTYKSAKLPTVTEHAGDSEFFASPESTMIIKRQIETVLEVESPVCRDVLCKRVLEAWGISRMGARINRRFDELLTAMRVKITSRGDTVFLWREDCDPNLYEDFRTSSSEDAARRNLEHIPPEEIAASVRHILKMQIGLPREDLEREVAKIFGFGRCTEPMTKCIADGIDIAVARKWAALDGSRVNASAPA